MPRYGYGQPPHSELERLLADGDASYRRLLLGFLDYADALCDIPMTPQENTGPCWDNPYFFGLDAAALYCLMATERPRCYVEVGSGYSTMFARRAIDDHQLGTRIISIDPEPRAEIDAICDEVVRRPFQDVAQDVVDEMSPGDILFIDSSHVVETNGDVTVVFLEVLPRLPPGVLVQFHDVFWPWDYRPDWLDRKYTEQYMLAVMLLGGSGYEVLLPVFHVYLNEELRTVLDSVWSRLGLLDFVDPLGLPRYATAGHSIWIRRR